MCGQAQDLPLQWFFGITLPNLKRHLERRSFPYRASIDISLLPDESGVRAESRQVPIYRNAPRWNRDRRNGTGFKTGAKAHVAPLGLGRGTHRPAINMSPLWGLGAMVFQWVTIWSCQFLIFLSVFFLLCVFDHIFKCFFCFGTVCLGTFHVTFGGISQRTKLIGKVDAEIIGF